jgi:hypothetical protein
MTAQEMLETTKLNWTVRKEEMVTKSGIIIPDKVAIVRDDTNSVLSVMGDGYEMFQNHQLMDLLYQISQSTGLQLHKSGLFDDGNLVYMQLKSDDLKLGNDRVEGFITGINSFNGATSLAFGNSSVTISCTNTFFKAFRSVDSKIRHTAGLQIRVDEILRNIDKLLLEEKQDFDKIKRMSETPMTPVMIDLVKKLLFQLDNTDRAMTLDDLSTRKQNQIARFDMDMDIELKSKSETAWGVFSSATRYTTHSASKNEIKNQQNKMVGKTGVIERQLFNEIYQMC